MRKDIMKIGAWAFIIAAVVVILLNALASASDQFGSITKANAQIIPINPSIKPGISLPPPRISLPPASPTPEPQQPGGTWTYENPPTPTPTATPSETANVTVTATPTIEPAATTATPVPTATSNPATTKKGILGLGIGLPCGSLLVFPLVICGAVALGRYKRKIR